MHRLVDGCQQERLPIDESIFNLEFTGLKKRKRLTVCFSFFGFFLCTVCHIILHARQPTGVSGSCERSHSRNSCEINVRSGKTGAGRKPSIFAEAESWLIVLGPSWRLYFGLSSIIVFPKNILKHYQAILPHDWIALYFGWFFFFFSSHHSCKRWLGYVRIGY